MSISQSNPKFLIGVKTDLLPAMKYLITVNEDPSFFNYKLRSSPLVYGWPVTVYDQYLVDGSKIEWLMLVNGSANYNPGVEITSTSWNPGITYYGPNRVDASISYDNPNVAGGTAETIAWTYTVPSGKQVVIEQINMFAAYLSGSTTAPFSLGNAIRFYRNNTLIAKLVLYENVSRNMTAGPYTGIGGDVFKATYEAQNATDGMAVSINAAIDEVQS